MSTGDELIDRLCSHVEPVRPLWSPGVRAALWVVFCFMVTVVWILSTGELRAGFEEQLATSPQLLAEVVVGLFSGIVAACFAFEMMIPGRVWTPVLKLVSIAPFLVFLLFGFYSMVDPALTPSWDGWRFGCEREILVYGAVPMLVFFLLGRKAAAVEKEWTGLLIGIASMVPAAAGMQLACMYMPWHTIIFHMLPVGVMGWLGFLLGRKYLIV